MAWHVGLFRWFLKKVVGCDVEMEEKVVELEWDENCKGVGNCIHHYNTGCSISNIGGFVDEDEPCVGEYSCDYFISRCGCHEE